MSCARVRACVRACVRARRQAAQFHLVFVLQWSGLKFIIVVAFKRNREARTGSIITALYEGEGELSLDDAFLYAAQQFGLEINLHQHKSRVGISVSVEA